MTHPPLILASTSPYRREALLRLGLTFTQAAPGCDEERLKDPNLSPAQLATTLARAKAESLRQEYPQAVIIGSDQVAECDGAILDKPHTLERAAAQLRQLSGTTHQLYTAVCLSAPNELQEHCDCTRLTMRNLCAATISRYLAADQPLDCAGSYKIEGAGISLFTQIISEDHSAITGLPLLALCRMLRAFAITIP